MVFLGILEWIVIGLVIGFIASKVVDWHGDDVRLGMFAATGGAILAAALSCIFSGTGVTAWNPWNLASAAAGASAGALVWHTVRSRYVSRQAYTSRSSY